MKNYFKFLLVAVMALSFGVAKAQTEKVVAIGDTVTLTSTNVGTNLMFGQYQLTARAFMFFPTRQTGNLKYAFLARTIIA